MKQDKCFFAQTESISYCFWYKHELCKKNCDYYKERQKDFKHQEYKDLSLQKISDDIEKEFKHNDLEKKTDEERK